MLGFMRYRKSLLDADYQDFKYFEKISADICENLRPN
jgi:hypothetical protein